VKEPVKRTVYKIGCVRKGGKGARWDVRVGSELKLGRKICDGECAIEVDFSAVLYCTVLYCTESKLTTN
jgi:hypothetical protein